ARSERLRVQAQDGVIRPEREGARRGDESPDEAGGRKVAGDSRVAILVVDEPEVGDGEQAERDDPADERAAIGGRRDRDLPREDIDTGDDQRAVDPEGQVVRLDEAEVLAPPGLLDRTAAVLRERAHDAARMLRIIATMSSRRREISPVGPAATISTPSPY